MHQISVGNFTIDIVRKDIKNLHLAVYPPEGRVRIATPLRLDDESVRLFAISKLAWIKRQQEKFRGQERQSAREYLSGESHYFEGQRYLLNVVYHDAPPKATLRNKRYIDLFVRPGSNRAQRQRVLQAWYRKHLKVHIPAYIQKWAPILCVAAPDWGIKLMKTKWGTCNIEDRRMWLNLELAKKPTRCLEYIVVHEMTHFLERHHNERFVAYMDKFLPNWRALKEEVNRGVLGV